MVGGLVEALWTSARRATTNRQGCFKGVVDDVLD